MAGSLKYILYGAVFFLVCMAIVGVRGALFHKAPPGVYFEQDVYECGNVLVDQVYHYTFNVRNNSNNEVLITKLQTSCGCTAAKPESDKIPAGGSTAINVSIDTKARPGTFLGQIAVQTDNAEYPLVTTQIKAEVRFEKGSIRSAPSGIDFGEVVAGTASKRTLVVVRSGQDPLNFVSASTEMPGITVTRVAKKVILTAKAADSEELEVLLSDKMPLGEFRGTIRIQTQDATYSTIDIPVRGTVVSPIEVAPNLIVVSSQDNSGISQTVRLRHANQVPFVVQECSLAPETLPGSVSSKQISASEWEITYAVEGAIPRAAFGNLNIKTDCPEAPSLLVPITLSNPNAWLNNQVVSTADTVEQP